MNKFDIFDQASSALAGVSLPGFIVNLLLAALLSTVLGKIYVHFGRSMSNRASFARIFPLMCMTTMIIITIVKASLALSLGLVGALSIVRFRAAIKEPEELVYLFICIAIGVGLGAEQKVIILTAFFVIVPIIMMLSKKESISTFQQLLITVNSVAPELWNISILENILKTRCRTYELKKVDKNSKHFSATFSVDLGDRPIDDIECDLRKVEAEHNLSLVRLQQVQV